MSEGALYHLLKGFFADCAVQLHGEGDHRGAERLAQASTHWLRHTHASHALAGPDAMPAQMVQQNLGHSSLATTTLYIQTEKQARLKAMQDFWGRMG